MQQCIDVCRLPRARIQTHGDIGKLSTRTQVSENDGFYFLHFIFFFFVANRPKFGERMHYRREKEGNAMVSGQPVSPVGRKCQPTLGFLYTFTGGPLVLAAGVLNRVRKWCSSSDQSILKVRPSGKKGCPAIQQRYSDTKILTDKVATRVT